MGRTHRWWFYRNSWSIPSKFTLIFIEIHRKVNWNYFHSTKHQWDQLPMPISVVDSSSMNVGLDVLLIAPSTVHQLTPSSLLELKTESPVESLTQHHASSITHNIVQTPWKMTFQSFKSQIQSLKLEMFVAFHWVQFSLLEETQLPQVRYNNSSNENLFNELQKMKRLGTNIKSRICCRWIAICSSRSFDQRRLPIKTFNNTSQSYLRVNHLHWSTSWPRFVYGRLRRSPHTRRISYRCCFMGNSMWTWITWYVRSYQQLP